MLSFPFHGKELDFKVQSIQAFKPFHLIWKKKKKRSPDIMMVTISNPEDLSGMLCTAPSFCLTHQGHLWCWQYVTVLKIYPWRWLSSLQNRAREKGRESSLFSWMKVQRLSLGSSHNTFVNWCDSCCFLSLPSRWF